MRPVLFVLCCVAFMASPARAAPSDPSSALPRFADFPAGPAYAGPHRLVLRRNDAQFRTMLREAVDRQPDFAGHYVLATWGCGAGCVMGAAIDVRTGAVTWLPGTLCCWDPDQASSSEPTEPLRFRLDSRLLVLIGRRNERNGDDGTHFYVIRNNRFVHLRDVPPARARP